MLFEKNTVIFLANLVVLRKSGGILGGGILGKNGVSLGKYSITSGKYGGILGKYGFI